MFDRCDVFVLGKQIITAVIIIEVAMVMVR